jgi:hypothetical protein
MEKRGRTGNMLLILFALTLWTSCNDEVNFEGTSHIQAIFQLKSATAMNGRITIEQAYLKLDRIRATGNLRGDNVTDITHSIPADDPPYKLMDADSGQVNFTLNRLAYNILDFHFYLPEDNYQLIFQNPVPVETPVPTEEGTDGDHQENDGDADNNDDDDGNQSGEDDNGHEDGQGDGGDDGSGNDDGNQSEDNEDDDDHDKNKGKDEEKDKDKNKGKDKDKGHKGGDDGGRTLDDKDTQTVDVNHFFQNAKPGMVVFGNYQNNGKTIEIIFVAGGIEKFSLRGQQNNTFDIALKEHNTAQITFDPQQWFASITPSQIESAALQTYQQQTILFIHRDFNAELYRALVERIEGSTEMTINSSTDGTSF